MPEINTDHEDVAEFMRWRQEGAGAYVWGDPDRSTVLPDHLVDHINQRQCQMLPSACRQDERLADQCGWIRIRLRAELRHVVPLRIRDIEIASLVDA